MKGVNTAGTKKLYKLYAAAVKNGGFLEIDNNGPDSGFMPVTVRILPKEGRFYRFSVAHNYVQNGDVMNDPEMTFVFPDFTEKYAESEDWGFVWIGPATFRQDNMGLYGSFLFLDEKGEGVKSYRPRMYEDNRVFAGQWMSNIWNQQSLSRAKNRI